MARGNDIKTKNKLNRSIAEIIARDWPPLPIQKNIAKELGVTQSKISTLMSNWKNKEDVPLNISYQCEKTELIEDIKEKYGIKNVSVKIFPFSKYFNRKKTYFKQLGIYAADIIIDKINEIDKSREHTLKIKITTSCGRSVSGAMLSVIEEIKGTDIKLEISGSSAIRSESLVELSPLHIGAPLLDSESNIDVTKIFQLPILSATPNSSFAETKGTLEEIVDQRIKTQPRFKFEKSFLESDIVVLGLGAIEHKDEHKAGFAKHIANEKMYPLMKTLGIQGEVAYAPFNKHGFLFHQFMEHMFEYDYNEKELKSFDENRIKAGLKKCAENPEEINSEHVIQAINLFSSIFTLNFCELVKSTDEKEKKPYVLLLVGGDLKKAKPLMTLLDNLQDKNIIDELIIGENIAEEVVKNIGSNPIKVPNVL